MSGAAVAGGAGAVVRQGYLRKLKTMKKKYFVLRAETAERSAKLEYYESEKKFRAGANPKRELSLKSCYNITRRLDLKQKHVIALFTREEQFCVVAENEKDLHDWLTDILKQHRADDASEELLHPIQHVWQVNVQKKGLGASKNIQGLYNLCLTDQTLALVKIKSSNNVISDLGIPERVEYSLKNIRRCGDSECFFYMEVGRQTVTGAGEIWMHSEDSNIAQSMHSTILHKMRNCAKETENDRDHIILPKNMSLSGEESNPRPRRQTIPHSTGRAGLCNGKGLCVGSCIRQCVCSTATYSIDDSAAAIAPLTPKNAEYQAPNNTLINDSDGEPRRVVKHHRTVSLPTGCTLYEEPLKIVHERTRSAPLTGDEVDRVMIDKVARHSSCKTVNGRESSAFPSKKSPWCRRASTGARLSKLSPAHTKNAGTLRNRCDSMPSRFGTAADMERTQARHSDMLDGSDGSRDELDAAGGGGGGGAGAAAGAGEWPRAPRIPEEPDYCDMTSRDLLSMSRTSMSGAAPGSRGSLLAGEEGAGGGGYGDAVALAAGYVPMLPAYEPGPGSGSGSVCSGTPSTDPRFFEYHLTPATSHIVDAPDERPPRAYSVGSRPGAARSAPAPPDARLRAYSVGARHRVAAAAPAPPPPRAPSSVPLLPSTSAEDLMELDFSANRPPSRALHPPPVPHAHPYPLAAAPPAPRDLDEYVDMSPRGAATASASAPASAPACAPPPAPPPPPEPAPETRADGYVAMDYSPRPPPTRPIAIAGVGARVALGAGSALGASPPTPREARTPLGSQTIFPLSLESPGSPLRASPPSPRTPLAPLTPLAPRDLLPERADSPVESSSPPYVRIAGGSGPAEASEAAGAAAGVGSGAGAPGLIYAALDLEPSAAASAAAHRLYTKIDFVRSEKMRSHAHAHADANTN